MYLRSGHCRKQLSKAGDKSLRLKLLKAEAGRKGLQRYIQVGSSTVGSVGVPEEGVMRLALAVLQKLQTAFSGRYSAGRNCLAR